ncbi:MAG: hypothetical protein HDR52_03395 [Treponema sp.]|nr:hypothetical protein [Treponema sp.]
MDFVSFDKGKRNLIIISELGNVFKIVKGMTIPMALMYKNYDEKNCDSQRQGCQFQ